MDVKRDSGAAPVRMCIGCRGRAGKVELLRLVWSGQGVLVDDSHTHPGRGAYLHRRSACLTQALRRRSLARALRVEGSPVDLERVTAGLLEPAGTASVGELRHKA